MRKVLVFGLVAAAILLPTATAEAAPALSALTTTPGTVWWTDPDSQKRTVSLDDTVRPAVAAALTRAVTRTGGTVLREPGTLRPHIAGGDPYNGGTVSGRCLVGFNAMNFTTGRAYFLTAAHCVPVLGATIYSGATGTATVLGVVAAKVPSYDLALVRYTNFGIVKPSAVNLFAGGLQPITSFAPGFVGQAVRRTGPAGVRAGTITALNVTINYAGGAVYGMIRTTVCSEPGESGGPLFAGTVGIGMNWGGSGTCATGGVSYYASASRAASTFDVTPY